MCCELACCFPSIMSTLHLRYQPGSLHNSCTIFMGETLPFAKTVVE